MADFMTKYTKMNTHPTLWYSIKCRANVVVHLFNLTLGKRQDVKLHTTKIQALSYFFSFYFLFFFFFRGNLIIMTFYEYF